ncbi:hypothetical protein K505DRAFT_329638 [Melanomma pulvis-pyrius CBS 109.77]|uniref:Uncharacterized protein n=1 Tax=Melanomma pulvis-pyrius CBS 109.77 TaxID=1314802 RepID=A0A6A6WTU0_9PLEO|nr:hypothetical protein K505DRAFT_329638 [Melanomma pulvis-pyrius CBS 109.77]
MSSSPKPSSIHSTVSTTTRSSTSTTSTRNAPLLATSTWKKAVKKPFQGWSKELLWAREGIDDDYNFASQPWGERRRK